MKKLLLTIGITLLLATQAMAADVWSYKKKQVQRNGDKVVIIVQILVNGVVYGGREVTLDYAIIKDLTTEQIGTLITNKVKNMKIEQSAEYNIKQKIPLNVEVILP